MNNLGKDYNDLLDEGKSITDLYIYHLIVNDERSFGYSEKEITDLVSQILDTRYNYPDLGLESIVDRLLNGDVLDGDEDEWISY